MFVTEMDPAAVDALPMPELAFLALPDEDLLPLDPAPSVLPGQAVSLAEDLLWLCDDAPGQAAWFTEGTGALVIDTHGEVVTIRTTDTEGRSRRVTLSRDDLAPPVPPSGLAPRRVSGTELQSRIAARFWPGARVRITNTLCLLDEAGSAEAARVPRGRLAEVVGVDAEGFLWVWVADDAGVDRLTWVVDAAVEPVVEA